MSNPAEQMAAAGQPVIQITVARNGKIVVQSNVADKVAMFGMLECARQAMQKEWDKKGDSPILV